MLYYPGKAVNGKTLCVKADELLQLLQPVRRAVHKEGDPHQLLWLCPATYLQQLMSTGRGKSVGRICTTPVLFNFVQVFFYRKG